jgi:hypothetical protein
LAINAYIELSASPLKFPSVKPARQRMADRKKNDRQRNAAAVAVTSTTRGASDVMPRQKGFCRRTGWFHPVAGATRAREPKRVGLSVPHRGDLASTLSRRWYEQVGRCGGNLPSRRSTSHHHAVSTFIAARKAAWLLQFFRPSLRPRSDGRLHGSGRAAAILCAGPSQQKNAASFRAGRRFADIPFGKIAYVERGSDAAAL